MHLVNPFFAEAASKRGVCLAWRLLHLCDQDVLDTLAVYCGLEIVRVDREIGPLNLLLGWVVAVLNSDAGQVLSIALDLNAVRKEQAVERATFLSHLSVVHACVEGVLLDLLKASVVVPLPSNALIDIRKVFN